MVVVVAVGFGLRGVVVRRVAAGDEQRNEEEGERTHFQLGF